MSEENKRKHERYETKLKIYFDIDYDMQTKVEYEIEGDESSEKHDAVGVNISTEGIGFVTPKKLNTGQMLNINVFVPGAEEAIPMIGEVRWSSDAKEKEYMGQFNTGVKLITVRGENVYDSIHFDEENNVEWSVVLESVVGDYAKLAKEKENEE